MINIEEEKLNGALKELQDRFEGRCETAKRHIREIYRYGNNAEVNGKIILNIEEQLKDLEAILTAIHQIVPYATPIPIF